MIFCLLVPITSLDGMETELGTALGDLPAVGLYAQKIQRTRTHLIYGAVYRQDSQQESSRHLGMGPMLRRNAWGHCWLAVSDRGGNAGRAYRDFGAFDGLQQAPRPSHRSPESPKDKMHALILKNGSRDFL